MDVLLIVLAFVYVAVALVVALASAGDWWLEKEAERTATAEKYRVEAERDARRAARRFFRAPLWPLMAIGGLTRMYAESREPEDR